MATYRLDILITGTDRASPRIQGFSRALRRVGQIAAGILIAGAIRGITDQIFGLGRTAFDAIVQLELMQVGLESLVARELARGTVVENAVIRELSLSDAQILTLDKLIVKRHALTEEMEEATSAYNDLVESEGLSSIETLASSIAMRELQIELEETTTKIGNLESQASGTITVFEKVQQGQMSLRDALELAQKPAEQLTKWVTRLALISPYEEKDIVDLLRQAAGYGFITQFAGDAVTETERLKLAQDAGVVTAQRVTVSILDLVAALGVPPEKLGRIGLALGQIRGHGRLLGQEVRQLAESGVGVDIMALAMGKTVEEFTALQKEGRIFAKDFLPALISLIEKDLAGSAERVSRTLKGLTLNFSELKRVALRNFFLPLKEQIAPALVELYDDLSSEENLAKMTMWGETFRDSVIGVWDWIKTLHGSVVNLKELIKDPWKLVVEITPDDWDAVLKGNIAGVGKDFQGLIDDIDLPGENLGFEEPENIAGGVLGALGALAGARILLGVLPKILATIVGALGWVVGAIGLVGLAVGVAGGLWAGNFLGIRDITDDAWKNYIKPAFEGILEWFVDDIIPVLETFRVDWTEKVWGVWIGTKGFIDTDLIPALMDVRNWLGIKIAGATVWAALKVENDLLPALADLRNEIKDETIPGIVTFVAKMRDDIPRAIQKWVGPLHNATRNVLPGFKKVYFEDIHPIWEDFVLGLTSVAVVAGGEFNRRVREGITQTLLLLGQGVKRDVLPHIDIFISRIRQIYLQSAVRFDDAYRNFFLPGLKGMAEWWVEHVNPAMISFGSLLESVIEVAGRLFGGFWRNIVLKSLGAAWTVFFEQLNPVLKDFWLLLIDVEEVLAVPLKESLRPYIDFFFPKFAGVLEWVERVLDDVRIAFDKLKRDLDGWELPDWASKSSPIPIVHVFDETARAINEADEAFRRNALFRGGNVSIGSPFMQPAFVVGGTQGPVTFEGDTNTFIVDSEATARFVTHQLREQKLKKFSEYMGR